MKLLVITCLCLLAAGSAVAKDWSAGEIQTFQEFKYGALEAKVKGSAGNGAITGLLFIKEG